MGMERSLGRDSRALPPAVHADATRRGSTQFRRHLSLAKYEDVRARLSNEPLLRTAGDRAGLIANPSAGMGHAAGAGTRKPTSRL
jgi:hypothetical protein